MGGIGHHLEGVLIAEVGKQGVEQLAIPLAEMAGADQLDGLAQRWISLQPGLGVVALLLQPGNLLGVVAEEEKVVGAHPLADLDIGPIEGADRESAIERHLHVAGAGGLLARSGDLLGEIHRRIHQLAEADAEVGQEHHPQPAAHGRIHVHDLGDAHDQADDQLGHGVARRRLAAKDHRARRQVFSVAQAQVALHHLQRRQMLALVFVDALYLHVEQGSGVHHHAELVLDVQRQALLGLQPGRLPALQKTGVAQEGLKLLQLGEIPPPALADGAIEQGAQGAVGHRQPAPRRHAVGHVGEAIGPDAGEISQHLLAQQLAVQFSHAVGVVTAHHRQMGHAHPALGTFLDQRHPLQQLRIAGVLDAHHAQEAGIDLVDDLQLAR